MKKIFSLGLVASLAFASITSAATLSVPSTLFPTIQSAVNASASGDVIAIAPGTYVENVSILNKTGITLVGTGGMPTITPTNNTQRGFVVANSININLDNLGFIDQRTPPSPSTPCVPNANFFMKISETKGFSIKNSILTGGSNIRCSSIGLDFNGVQDVVVSNVNITNFFRNGITLTSIFGGAASYEPKNFLFENITLINNAQNSNWAQFAIYTYSTTTNTGSIISNVGFSGVNTIDNGRNGMRIDTTNGVFFSQTPLYVAGNGTNGPTGIPVLDLSTFEFKKINGYFIQHAGNNDTNVDALLTKFYDYNGNLLNNYTDKNQIENLLSHDCEDSITGSGDNPFYHGLCSVHNVGSLPAVCNQDSGSFNTILCAINLSQYTQPRIPGNRSFDTTNPNKRPNLGSIRYTLEYSDLGLTKTISTGLVLSGGTISYRLNITNYGPDRASGLTITEIYPTGFVYISSSLAPNMGNNIFTIANLASGASISVLITGSIVGNSGNIFTNSASIKSDTPETGTNNNTGMVTGIIYNTGVDNFDLSIIKTAVPTRAMSGDEVFYSITITNHGPSIARGIVLTEHYPTGFIYTESTIDPFDKDDGEIGGGGDGGFEGEFGINDNNIFLIPDLLSGDSVTFFIFGDVTGNSGDVLRNVAHVSAPNETGSLSNTGTADVVIFGEIIPSTGYSDLGLVKIVSSGSVLSSTNVWYTITVTNYGPNNATGVTITEIYPTGFMYISSSLAPSMGNNIFTIANLASGASTQITITGRVIGTSGQTLINTAYVSSNTVETGTNSNTGTASLLITGIDTGIMTGYSDLGLVKIVSSGSVLSGTNVGYTITVTNYGPNNATGVTITEIYPTGFMYISSSLAPSMGNDIFTIANLASGASTQITITGRVIGTSGQTLINTAYVSSNTVETGTNSNTGTANVLITGITSVILSPSPIMPGGSTYNPVPIYTPISTTTTIGVDGSKIPTTNIDTNSLINNIPNTTSSVLVLRLQNNKKEEESKTSFTLPDTGVR